jgi:hypothetical protein
MTCCVDSPRCGLQQLRGLGRRRKIELDRLQRSWE